MVTMNRLDPRPSSNATDVARAATREEWLDGMPPVRHIRVAMISRGERRGDFRITMTAFINCARNQLVREERKIGFSAKETSADAL